MILNIRCRFSFFSVPILTLILAGCSSNADLPVPPHRTPHLIHEETALIPNNSNPPLSTQNAWARARRFADDADYTQIYTNPDGALRKTGFSITLNRSRAETWRLFRQVAPSRYIRVIEEDEEAGVMVAVFNDRNIDDYVDCGSIAISGGPYDFSGPYARYLKQNTRTDFYSRMTIVMRQQDDESTEIRVDADYQITSSAALSPSRFVMNRWEFKTGTSDTIKIEGIDPNSDATRQCRPKHRIEQLVIESLRAL